MAITMTQTQRSVVATGSDTTNYNKFLDLDPLTSDDTNVKVVRFIVECDDTGPGVLVTISQDSPAGTEVDIFERVVNVGDQYILDRNAGGFGEWMINPKVKIASGSAHTVQMIYE